MGSGKEKLQIILEKIKETRDELRNEIELNISRYRYSNDQEEDMIIVYYYLSRAYDKFVTLFPDYEWEFDKPSSEVDLNKICDQLNVLKKTTINALIAFNYMEQLKIKAPVVYGRLTEYAKKNKVLTWWDFDKK